MRSVYLLSLAAWVGTLAACGSDPISEAEAKQAYAETVCPRNLECYSAEVLDTYGWETAADCVEDLSQSDMDGDRWLDEDCAQDELDTCLDAIDAASCEAVEDGSGFLVPCASVTCE